MADIAKQITAGRREVAMWICALQADASEAQLWYPARMSEASQDDLIEWLDFVLRTLKQRRQRQSGLAPRSAGTSEAIEGREGR